MEKTLEKMVEQYQKGDLKLGELILKQLEPLMFKYCVTYYYPGYELADVKQLIRLSVIDAIQCYEPEKYHNFSAFAKCVVLNDLKDKLQSINFPTNKMYIDAVSVHASEAVADYVNNLPHQDMLVEHQIVEKDSISKMIEIITTTAIRSGGIYPKVHLKDIGTMLIMLSNGYSYAEIASTFNTKKKTIDNLLSHVHNMLKTNGITAENILEDA